MPLVLTPTPPSAVTDRWTIQGIDAATGAGLTPELDFKSLKYSRFKRVRASLVPQKVTFSTALNFDGVVLYPEGSTILIRNAGTVIFHGRITKIPRAGSGTAESLSYEAACPLWYLQNCTYQMEWNISTITGDVTTLVPTYKPRVIFGQHLTPDGYEKIGIREQITDILDYAIGLGAPFQRGEIDPSLIIPYQEAKDVTCLEALIIQLRFAPDTVSKWDFSTFDPANAARPLPTLHLLQRGSCRTIYFSVSHTALGTDLSIVERTDMRPPSVCLKYERVNSIDGQEITEIVPDIAPDGATGQEFGAVVMTMELSGTNATHQRQSVTTASIGKDDFAWWQKKLKDLVGAQISQAQDDSGAPLPYIVPETSIISAVEGLTPPGVAQPAEVISGAVPKWLADHANACHVTVQANYRVTDIRTGFYQDYKNVTLSCNVHGTDLTTNEYENLTSFTAGEPIPDGIAAWLYALLQIRQFDLEWTTVEKECSMTVDEACLLNFLDGAPEWESMDSQVQQIEEDFDSGTTHITGGPAKHLGFDDFVALLRVNRGRVVTYRLDERATGKTATQGQVDGDNGAANENSSKRENVLTIVWKDAGGGNLLFTDPTPGDFRVGDQAGNTFGQIKTDGTKISFWFYDSDGVGKQIKFDTSTGKLEVWDETSGKYCLIEPGRINIADPDGSYLNLTKNVIDYLDGGTGNELYLDLSTLPTGASYITNREFDACKDGDPKKVTVLASDFYDAS